MDYFNNVLVTFLGLERRVGLGDMSKSYHDNFFISVDIGIEPLFELWVERINGPDKWLALFHSAFAS